MVSIILKGISKKYGAKTALFPSDLDIKDREIFCLIGPSGSGKTTLLRIIAGLETPTEGEVYFDKREVTSLKPSRRNIGMVFQDYALWPHMDVYHNVSMVLKNKIQKDEERRKVESILKRVGLSHKSDSRISELSGGEMQRVALARALIMEPDILLMDEPLSNLDAKIKQSLMVEMLRIIKEQRITTVLVTHAQEEAYEMADRIAVMNRGEVEQVGEPEDLYRNPTNLFVADFMADNILMPVTLSGRSQVSVTVTGKMGTMNFGTGKLPLGFESGIIVARISALSVKNSMINPSLSATILDYKFKAGGYDMLLQLPDSTIITKNVEKKSIQIGKTAYLGLEEGSYHIFPNESNIPVPA